MVKKFSESEKSEIIELALSDHATFDNIKSIYGIGEKDVKKLMRENLNTLLYQYGKLPYCSRYGNNCNYID